MKLRAICEEFYDANWTLDEVVQEIEEYVHERAGQLDGEHVKYLAKFFGGFSPQFLQQVADKFSCDDPTPQGLVKTIQAGAALGYEDEDDAKGLNYLGHGPPFKSREDEIPSGWGSLDSDELHTSGPTARDLAATDAWLQNKPKPVDNGPSAIFQNAPPAAQPQPGGTPSLAAVQNIQTNNGNRLGEVFSEMSPADLIDDPATRPEVSQPFIYANGRLYVGERNSYHHKIMSELPAGSREEKVLNNVYSSGDYDANYNNVPGSALPGTVGRIGYGFRKMAPALSRATIVTMYAKAGASSDVIKKTIQELVKGGYAIQDSMVIIGDNVSTVAEFMGGNEVAEISEEDKVWEDMRRNYWVDKWSPEQVKQVLDNGNWPNQAPVTAPQRAMLLRKFKLGGGGGVKKGWQKAMEKAGLINPGQKWWAPTSESTSRRGRPRR